MAIQPRLLTLRDYHAICAMPESADRILELIDGEIVEKMPGFEPSEIAITIAFYIKLFLQKFPLGYITGADGGYVMSPRNVFIPDVGYISKERLPERPSREAPVPPDLAIEIKSPSDSKRKMRRKAKRYLDFGTRLVWLVFPKEQTIEVYAINEEMRVIGMDGMLDGGEVLPGFTLNVKDVFSRE